MPPAAQTRRITILVDAKGSQVIDDIANKLGGVNRNTKELSKGLTGLTSTMTTFLGGLTIRELANFSDEIQNLNNRLLTMTGSQAEATSTLNTLVGVARETNQSIDSISQGYFRMSLALKDVGISQGTMIDLTKTIANTFRLAGATTQETANATIQLGQAFSLGVLRGQDLRSVMSQNLVLARLLKQEFGNNLMKAAEQGLITVPRLMDILHKNMGKVNSQAKVMSATFDQSLTKAIDAFKLKVFDVSSALNASGIFATAVDWTIEHMDLLAAAVGVLAVGTLPKLAKSLFSVVSALGLTNPLFLIFAAGLAGLAGAIALFGDSWNITDLLKQMQAGFATLLGHVDNLIAKFYELAASITIISSVKDDLTKLGAAARNAATDHFVHAQAIQNERAVLEELSRRQKESGKTTDKWAEDLRKAYAKFKIDETPLEMLKALNKEFHDTTIGVVEYNKRILEFDMAKANYQFKEGKINLDQLNAATEKVNLFRINQAYDSGALSVRQYGAAVNDVKLYKLNQDLESGKISLSDYNLKLAEVSNNFSATGAFRTGLQGYVHSIGSTTVQVSNVIKGAFSDLENVFLEFTKTGKFNFDKFTEGVLDDLTKIIIRASIIQPLANGILGYMNPTSTPGATGVASTQYITPDIGAAKGAYFDGGIAKFASGGVVSSPTAFGFGNGKTGLMGEKGPEAILPLQRGAGGNLGVSATVTPVNINIVNNTSSEISQHETMGPSGERTIEIMINNKVKEGFSAGKFDRVMQQSYGLRRKGS